MFTSLIIGVWLVYGWCMVDEWLVYGWSMSSTKRQRWNVNETTPQISHDLRQTWTLWFCNMTWRYVTLRDMMWRDVTWRDVMRIDVTAAALRLAESILVLVFFRSLFRSLFRSPFCSLFRSLFRSLFCSPFGSLFRSLFLSLLRYPRWMVPRDPRKGLFNFPHLRYDVRGRPRQSSMVLSSTILSSTILSSAVRFRLVTTAFTVGPH